VGYVRHKVRLSVRSAEIDDVYKDIVRISEESRGPLKTGRVHKFATGSGTAHFILRGSSPSNVGKILMDEAARAKLKLEPSAECDFDIQEVGFWGELRWAWSATDPTYRVAGKLGVLSFVLGVISLILGFAAICAEMYSVR
jgi:hypothetical protein